MAIRVTWHEPVEREGLDGFNHRVMHHYPGFWRATDADDPMEEYPEVAVDWYPATDGITVHHGEDYEWAITTGSTAERLLRVLQALLTKRAEVR